MPRPKTKSRLPGFNVDIQIDDYVKLVATHESISVMEVTRQFFLAGYQTPAIQERILNAAKVATLQTPENSSLSSAEFWGKVKKK